MEKKTYSDVELFNMAKEVSEKAYTPFSGFNVGAALLTDEGEVFTGVNIENSSLGATICAERSACACAVSKGYRKFKAIAVYSKTAEAWPCGICRQFLYEFAPTLRVITGLDEEHLRVKPLNEILLEGFRLEGKVE